MKTKKTGSYLKWLEGRKRKTNPAIWYLGLFLISVALFWLAMVLI